MGDEETMKMLMGENLRIMVGGQVVGMAKKAKFSIAEDEASTKESFLVHRLVAMAFVEGYQDGYDVNHKDENKQNNRADNLEWVKHVDNINYGTHNEGATAHNVGKRRKVVQMSLDGQDLQSFDSLLSASKATGIDVGSIGNVCKGKCKTAGGYRWKYIE